LNRDRFRKSKAARAASYIVKSIRSGRSDDFDFWDRFNIRYGDVPFFALLEYLESLDIEVFFTPVSPPGPEDEEEQLRLEHVVYY
jgi:hypothetical protein